VDARFVCGEWWKLLEVGMVTLGAGFMRSLLIGLDGIGCLCGSLGWACCRHGMFERVSV
jgi:hypothetical protein